MTCVRIEHGERMTQMFRRNDVLSALDDAGITYTVPPADDGA